MWKITITFIALSFLGMACSDSDTLSVSEIIDKSGNKILLCHYQNIPEEKQKLNLSDLVEDLKIVHFENSDTAVFHYRSKPTISDNYVGIAQERSSFLLFDHSGRFKCQVGNIGQGPGEYPKMIYDAIIDEKNEEIYLSSFGFSNKILVYDLNGRYKRYYQTSYRLNKPKIMLGENRDLTIMHLPFRDRKNENILISVFDQQGNLKKRLKSVEYLLSDDFSQDLFAVHNVPQLSFFITSCDTLYHYNSEKNQIIPKLTMDFGSIEEKPTHIYYEIPSHYIVFIFGKGAIFIDKKTKTAKYMQIVNDLCGHMERPQFGYKNGWAYAMLEPNHFIGWIKERLDNNDCSEQDKKLLKPLLQSLNEEDNNVLLMAKLKQL